MGVVSVQTDQMWREFVTRPAMRIAEDKEHLPAPVFFQRNHTTLEVGKAKSWRASPNLQPLPLDLTCGEWPLARKSPSLNLRFADIKSTELTGSTVLGQCDDPICTTCEWPSHLPLLIQQICYRCTLINKRRGAVLIVDQEDRAVQAMFG